MDNYKEAIEKLSKTIYWDEIDIEVVELEPLEAKGIISLLQQGEKYRQMYLWSGNLCEELKEELKKYKEMWDGFHYGLAHINIGSYQNPLDKKMTDLECVNKIVKNLKQKYFLKE